MMPLEVVDFKGRRARLLKNRGYMTAGSRYITRASVRAVINGEALHLRGGSADPHAIKLRRAHVSPSRLRIGCHVFSGKNFQIIKEWALAAQ